MVLNPITQHEMDALLVGVKLIDQEHAEFAVAGDIHPSGHPIIRVSGKVLGSGAASLVERTAGHLDLVPGHLIVDCTECRFFSSMALGFLWFLAEQRREQGSELLIVSADEQIKKMIYMLGMRDAFHLFPSLVEALERIEEWEELTQEYEAG